MKSDVLISSMANELSCFFNLGERGGLMGPLLLIGINFTVLLLGLFLKGVTDLTAPVRFVWLACFVNFG